MGLVKLGASGTVGQPVPVVTLAGGSLVAAR